MFGLGASMPTRKRAPQHRRTAPTVFDDALLRKHAGLIVARRREALGLSQDELGLLIGVTNSAINAFEKGRYWLRVHLLLRLGTILRLDLSDLLPPPAPSRLQ